MKILSLNDDSKLLNEQSNDNSNTSTATLAAVDVNDTEQQQKINTTLNSSILDESVESNVNSDESLMNESNNEIDLINKNDVNSFKKNNITNNRKSNHLVHTNNFYSNYYTRPDMI
jgi:hypothetical protein